MSTTGQIVMHYADMGVTTVISEDCGPYPGTVPELDVRKLRRIEEMRLPITHPAVKAISERGSGYGCGWSDTGALHPVTDADIANLRSAAIAAHPPAAPASSEDLPGEGAWWRYAPNGERELLD